MSLIYFAGAVDFAKPEDDLTPRGAFFSLMMASGHILYDATSAVKCNPQALDPEDAQKVMKMHAAMIKMADVFVAEMPERTVGVVSEMQQAFDQKKKLIIAITESPQSLYLMGMCDIVTADWELAAKEINTFAFDEPVVAA